MRARATWLSITAACAGLAVAAPVASAGQVFLQGGDQLRFFAGDNETNIVTLDRNGDVYTVTDTGAPLTILPMGGCTSVSASQATCPVAPVTGFSIELRNLNDQATIGPGIVSGADLNLNVSADEGNDTLNAGPSFRFGNYFGGDDNDTLNGGPRSDRLGGGDGNDTLLGADGGDSLDGGNGNDNVQGQAGSGDSIDSSNQTDGADILSGGPGEFDSLDYRRGTDTHLNVNGLPDDGGNCPGAGCEGDNISADFERLDTGDADDVVRAGSGSQVIFSADGDDDVDGQGGNDSIIADDGSDNVKGGAGDDTIRGGGDSDQYNGGSGDDTLIGDTSDLAADSYAGGAGLDLADFANASESLRIDLDNKPDDGRAGEGDNVRKSVEDVTGGIAGDLIVGSKAANELSGGGGGDRLRGGAGADGLLGGSGADLLIGGKASDLLQGGAGPDRLKARDGRRDEVRCGSAADTAVADRTDRVAADCDKRRIRR
jgi:Ca2+-binding RTX toxin-like protein